MHNLFQLPNCPITRLLITLYLQTLDDGWKGDGDQVEIEYVKELAIAKWLPSETGVSIPHCPILDEKKLAV